MGWLQLVFCIPLVAGLLLAAGAGFHHGHDLWLPRVMLGCLIFGGLGMVLVGAGAPLALAGAAVGTLALTRRRLVQRLLPSAETYLVSRHDFAGCSGTLLLAADAQSGYAQIKDREGNVHNLRCRSADGALEKGAPILVVEYDAESQLYLVAAHPLQGGHPW